MTQGNEDDRRRFFRITDAIGVSYQLLDEHGEPEDIEDEEGLEESISINMLLDQHNQSIHSALEKLQSEQPLVADALSELNKKLDTLLVLFELDDLSGNSRFQEFEQASISASGIAFPVTEQIAKDRLLQLDLLLQPSGKELQAIGRVVGCQSSELDGYYLRVEFKQISDADREELIQHIVQRQGMLLKSLREQMDF